MGYISQASPAQQGKPATKNGDFNYDRFIAEVTVTTPLSADDALRLHDWIKGQVKMPVVMNVLTSDRPSD